MSNELSILYEDNHLIVVDKPSGVLVQGDRTGDETLADQIKEYIKVKYDKPGNVFLGTVHRLDRPVSGVIVFAKTSKALSRLNEQLRKGKFEKIYLAKIEGRLQPNKGRIINYLKKNSLKNVVSVVSKDVSGAKHAETIYTVLNTTEDISTVRLSPITGRSHQLRVHMANLGHPIVGDLKYGSTTKTDGRSIMLHANSLSFIHPTTKEKVTFSSKPNWL